MPCKHCSFSNTQGVQKPSAENWSSPRLSNLWISHPSSPRAGPERLCSTKALLRVVSPQWKRAVKTTPKGLVRRRWEVGTSHTCHPWSSPDEGYPGANLCQTFETQRRVVPGASTGLDRNSSQKLSCSPAPRLNSWSTRCSSKWHLHCANAQQGVGLVHTQAGSRGVGEAGLKCRRPLVLQVPFAPGHISSGWARFLQMPMPSFCLVCWHRVAVAPAHTAWRGSCPAGSPQQSTKTS